MQNTYSTEVAPEGWEDTVVALKDHPEVSNPWALAYWMRDRGYQPRKESGELYSPAALHRRYQFDRGRDEERAVARETNGGGALGALQRTGAHACDKNCKSCTEAGTCTEALRESAPTPTKTHGLEQSVREWCQIREAIGQAPTADVIPVVLLMEGPGNARDRFYYTSEAIHNSARIFEGTACFLDHPSASEEDDRPERSVRDKCGWYSNARSEMVEGKASIVADLHLAQNAAGREARDIIATDRQYRMQYPDSVWAGFSINAAGHAEPGEIDGSFYKVVRSLERASSSDLVTFPGAGGKALGFREAAAVMNSRHFRATFAGLLQ